MIKQHNHDKIIKKKMSFSEFIALSLMILYFSLKKNSQNLLKNYENDLSQQCVTYYINYLTFKEMFLRV